MSPRKASSVTAAYTKDSPEPRAGAAGKRSRSLSIFFNKGRLTLDNKHKKTYKVIWIPLVLTVYFIVEFKKKRIIMHFMQKLRLAQ